MRKLADEASKTALWWLSLFLVRPVRRAYFDWRTNTVTVRRYGWQLHPHVSKLLDKSGVLHNPFRTHRH